MGHSPSSSKSGAGQFAAGDFNTDFSWDSQVVLVLPPSAALGTNDDVELEVARTEAERRAAEGLFERTSNVWRVLHTARDIWAWLREPLED